MEDHPDFDEWQDILQQRAQQIARETQVQLQNEEEPDTFETQENDGVEPLDQLQDILKQGAEELVQIQQQKRIEKAQREKAELETQRASKNKLKLKRTSHPKEDMLNWKQKGIGSEKKTGAQHEQHREPTAMSDDMEKELILNSSAELAKTVPKTPSDNVSDMASDSEGEKLENDRLSDFQRDSERKERASKMLEAKHAAMLRAAQATRSKLEHFRLECQREKVENDLNLQMARSEVVQVRHVHEHQVGESQDRQIEALGEWQNNLKQRFHRLDELHRGIISREEREVMERQKKQEMVEAQKRAEIERFEHQKSLEEWNERLNETADKLNEQKKQIGKEREELKAEQNRFREETQKTKSELDDMRKSLETERDKLENDRLDVNREKEDIPRAFAAETQRLENEQTQIEKQRDEVEVERSRLKDETTKMDQREAELDQIRDSLDAQKKQLEAERVTFEHQKESTKNEIDEISQKLTEKAQALEVPCQALDDQKKAFREKEAILDDMSREREEAKRSVDEEQQRLCGESRNLMVFQQELEQKEADLLELLQKCACDQGKNVKAMYKLKTQNGELRKRLEEKEQKLMEYQNRLKLKHKMDSESQRLMNEKRLIPERNSLKSLKDRKLVQSESGANESLTTQKTQKMSPEAELLHNPPVSSVSTTSHSQKSETTSTKQDEFVAAFVELKSQNRRLREAVEKVLKGQVQCGIQETHCLQLQPQQRLHKWQAQDKILQNQINDIGQGHSDFTKYLHSVPNIYC